jgi:hypothetical protein
MPVTLRMENEGEIIIKSGVDGGSGTPVGSEGGTAGASAPLGMKRAFTSFSTKTTARALNLGRMQGRFGWQCKIVSVRMNGTNGHANLENWHRLCSGGGRVSAYTDHSVRFQALAPVSVCPRQSARALASFRWSDFYKLIL